MQGNVPELIRQLMDAQQLSVRKVSARIAAQHGGSEHGYTQQINRILNDSTYDPSLTTVQKILSALNVSLWQVSQTSQAEPNQLELLTQQYTKLSQELGEMRRSIDQLSQAVMALTQLLVDRSDRGH
ncbi:MAG: XRE family transcriptional regulator [Leptolyngbyaceae cyanobacterium SL_7_1]|nr:XRE family transcriptional regulator [Leptolyngbyaceae cyanobacterium SL_7_1]